MMAALAILTRKCGRIFCFVRADEVMRWRSGDNLMKPVTSAFGRYCCKSRKSSDPENLATGMKRKSILIFRNRVNPTNQKYSAFVLPQISPITPLVSRQMRALANVTNAR
jgi:hypothetical protein